MIVWTALESTYEQSTDLTGEGSKGIAKGVLAMIFLYNLSYAIGWGPLQVTYVVEILPYQLRARVSPPTTFQLAGADDKTGTCALQPVCSTRLDLQSVCQSNWRDQHQVEM